MVFGVKWWHRSRRKERSYLRGMAEVCVVGGMAEVSLGQGPGGSRVPNLAPEMAQQTQVGKAQLLSGGCSPYLQVSKDPAQSGLMATAS